MVLITIGLVLDAVEWILDLDLDLLWLLLRTGRPNSKVNLLAMSLGVELS